MAKLKSTVVNGNMIVDGDSILEGNLTISGDISNEALDLAWIPYGVATGTANVYAVTVDKFALVDGKGISVKIPANSTGACTLNVNGLGAKPIKKGNKGDANNLQAGSIYTFRYDITTGNFFLQGEGGSGNATASDILANKTATTDAGDVTGTMPNRKGAKIANYSTQIDTVDSFTTDNNGCYGIVKARLPVGGCVDENTIIEQTVFGANPACVKTGQKIGNSGTSIVGSYDKESTNPITSATVVKSKVGFVNGSKVVGSIEDRGDFQFAGGFGQGGAGDQAYYSFNSIPEGWYRKTNSTYSWSPEIRMLKQKVRDALGVVASKIASGQTIADIAGTFSSDGTATADQILSGKIAYSKGNKITGTMTSNASQVDVISVGTYGTKKYFRIPKGAYLNEATTGYPEIVATATQIDSNIVAGNIKHGVPIAGVVGAYDSEASNPISAGHVLAGKVGFVNGNKVTGNMPNKAGLTVGWCGYETVTVQQHPSDASQALVTVPNAWGVPGYYDGNSKVTANIANLKADTIKAGVVVGRTGGNAGNSIVGTFTSDANATADKISSGYVAYVKGNRVVGTGNRSTIGTTSPALDGSGNLSTITVVASTVIRYSIMVTNTVVNYINIPVAGEPKNILAWALYQDYLIWAYYDKDTIQNSNTASYGSPEFICGYTRLGNSASGIYMVRNKLSQASVNPLLPIINDGITYRLPVRFPSTTVKGLVFNYIVTY